MVLFHTWYWFWMLVFYVLIGNIFDESKNTALLLTMIESNIFRLFPRRWFPCGKYSFSGLPKGLAVSSWDSPLPLMFLNPLVKTDKCTPHSVLGCSVVWQVRLWESCWVLLLRRWTPQRHAYPHKGLWLLGRIGPLQVVLFQVLRAFPELDFQLGAIPSPARSGQSL